MKRLEQLSEALEEMMVDRDLVVSEMFDIAYEYEIEEIMSDIVGEEEIGYLIEDRMNIGGWQSVTCLLANIEYLNDSYYMLDGYGNLKDITIGYLECLIHDMINELERQGIE